MGAFGPSIEINDFSGGLNTFDPEYSSDLTQSPDLDNLIILDKGFKKRYGDTKWNGVPMVDSGTAIQGGGYVKFDSGTEFLTAVAGAKFFSDNSLGGTMADVTGSVSITAGQNNLWTPINFNDLQIWFGGPSSNPDAPFKYSGSGNIAALGGTPPSAATVFGANNRIFAISTAANPSRIFWPVISNPEDWTGAGSGNSDVALSDGEALQFGVSTGPDTAVLFKNSSTHMMITTTAPFPIYQLQKGIGAAGARSFAYANGVIYFITPGRRMKMTQDGMNFMDAPNDINDIWDTINPTRIPYIQGIYYQALEWIMWFVSIGTSTTNNTAIIWDIQHKCFLRCTTGFKCNAIFQVQNRRLFAGHYDGSLYEKLKPSVFGDDSEGSPGVIDAYWRTPFKNDGSGLDATIHPLNINVSALTETSSTLDISYGFDFIPNFTTQTFSIFATGGRWDEAIWDSDVWGGQNATILTDFVFGRGNLFSFRMRNAIATQPFTVQGASIRLRPDKARKVFTAT
jgi:hypothetical protein